MHVQYVDSQGTDCFKPLGIRLEVKKTCLARCKEHSLQENSFQRMDFAVDRIRKHWKNKSSSVTFGINWTPSENSDVRVTVATADALYQDIERRMSTGMGCTVATLNLDHVVKLQNDPAFRAAYARHSHVTADGNPIVWLSRLARHDVDLIPGSDLLEPLIEQAAQHSWPVAFFGSTQGTLDVAADRLVAAYPNLNIVRCIAPPMGFDPESADADEMADDIASVAKICLIALGAPKQERFAARAAERHPHIGFFSIGASLDFVAGAQVRAPAWVRAIAAEWFWRLLNSPVRLVRRYGACIAILPRLFLWGLKARRQQR